jgi:PhoPQ-activated pathogenicity-related protein
LLLLFDCDKSYCNLFENMKAHVVLVLVLAAIGTHVKGELTNIASVLDSAGHLEDWLIATRRELHQYPELMFEVRRNLLFL